VTEIIGFLKSDAVKRMMIVTVLVFWCATMVAVRVKRTGSGYYVFLLGNLFSGFRPTCFQHGFADCRSTAV
jgi:hypothetical protein